MCRTAAWSVVEGCFIMSKAAASSRDGLDDCYAACDMQKFTDSVLSVGKAMYALHGSVRVCFFNSLCLCSRILSSFAQTLLEDGKRVQWE